MSATGRNVTGRERDSDDFYATPAWATRAVLADLPWWTPTLDPGCGTGAILAECVRARHAARVVGVESHPERAAIARAQGLVVTEGDALARDWTGEHVVCNPPYRDAAEWVGKAVREAVSGLFLVRLGFLAGQRRASLFRAHPPDYIGVLSKRPSFAHGRTDATDYAWVGWRVTYYAGAARLSWLLPEGTR